MVKWGHEAKIAFESPILNEIFLVGNEGRVVTYNRCSFNESAVDSLVAFNGVCAGDGENVFAVGDHGAIYHYDDPPATDVCPDEVNVSVGSGMMPSVSWEPACAISAAFITEARAGHSKWFLNAEGNLIEPSVFPDEDSPCQWPWGEWFNNLEIDSLVSH
jgi:hypothetical protein